MQSCHSHATTDNSLQLCSWDYAYLCRVYDVNCIQILDKLQFLMFYEFSVKCCSCQVCNVTVIPCHLIDTNTLCNPGYITLVTPIKALDCKAMVRHTSPSTSAPDVMIRAVFILVQEYMVHVFQGYSCLTQAKSIHVDILINRRCNMVKRQRV